MLFRERAGTPHCLRHVAVGRRADRAAGCGDKLLPATDRFADRLRVVLDGEGDPLGMVDKEGLRARAGFLQNLAVYPPSMTLYEYYG